MTKPPPHVTTPYEVMIDLLHVNKAAGVRMRSVLSNLDRLRGRACGAADELIAGGLHSHNLEQPMRRSGHSGGTRSEDAFTTLETIASTLEKLVDETNTR